MAADRHLSDIFSQREKGPSDCRHFFLIEDSHDLEQVCD